MLSLWLILINVAATASSLVSDPRYECGQKSWITSLLFLYSILGEYHSDSTLLVTEAILDLKVNLSGCVVILTELLTFELDVFR